jgi:hypothetical protein
MFNKLAIQSLVASTVLGLALAFSASPAAAQSCGGKGEPECPPDAKVICHNIGGPNDLGANCDGTGNCSYELDGGGVIGVAVNNFLGIIIGFNQDSDGALNAHLNHGDGFVSFVFDPPLHLASIIGPHQASNVECLATRAITTQPPEPGN